MIPKNFSALLLAAMLAGVAGAASAQATPANVRVDANTGSGRNLLEETRAQLARPRDAAIKAALAQSREAAGVVAPQRSSLENATALLSPAEWTWITMAAFWASALAIAAAIWRGQKPPLVIAAVTASLGLVAGAALLTSMRRLDDVVVVAQGGAKLLLSPFDTAQTEATLLPGEELIPLGREGKYLRVGDGRGRAGWLDSRAVVALVPQS